MNPLIGRSQLQDLLIAPRPPVLLHVLPPEHFAECRLPGARNACIYETAFLETIRELGLTPTDPIVVYGEGAPSLDSEVAAARLRSAGYQNVSDFRGGLREWQLAGLPVEGSGSSPGPRITGRFDVDTEQSVIRWTGRNLFNHHEGTVRLASGWLDITTNTLTAAEFVIDMRSIVCTDLTDSAFNAMLLRHLSTDDFFATEEHPTARFAIHSAEALPLATQGTPNYMLNGDFTLRGVTRALAFPAVIAAADPDHLTGQALIQLDRTDFGSLYGSGRFFAFLGKHVVNDHIDLHLKVHAARR
ncbi:MAG TPA: YceI family protein [Prosthecobacter sp.]|nr:YceI family protein [Prosthecobacter sp.]